MACVLRVSEHVPALYVLGADELGIVDETCGAPHISHRIVVCILAEAFYVVEAVHYVRGKVACVVRGVAEIAVYRQEEVIHKHPLDDVVGWADQVVILVAQLDLGEHGFVYVKGLVYDCDFLPGLFFVPLFELCDEVFIDVVRPVVNLEDLLTRSAAGSKYAKCEQNACQFFHFTACLDLNLDCLMLIIIRSISTTRKMMVISGLSSGVRPPLRASA